MPLAKRRNTRGERHQETLAATCAAARNSGRLPLAFHVGFRFGQNNFVIVHFFYPAKRNDVVFAARFRIAFSQLDFVFAFEMVNDANVFTVNVYNLSVI